MLQNLPLILVRCLLLTILIEGVTALILGVRSKKDLLNTVLVNLITNPVVVFSVFTVGYFFGNRVRMPLEYAEEIAVVLIEGLIYNKVMDYRKINPFLLSLILNGASYACGFIFNKS